MNNFKNLLIVILIIATSLTIFALALQAYKKTLIYDFDPDMECGFIPQDLEGWESKGDKD